MSDISNELIFTSDEIEMTAKLKTSRKLAHEAALTNIQQTLLQHGFYYTHANKCEQLVAELGKFDYARSTKRALVTYTFF
jgi:uncharacterized protein YcgL (UPF0745 family)